MSPHCQGIKFAESQGHLGCRRKAPETKTPTLVLKPAVIDHPNSVAMPSWDTLVIGGTSQQRSLASAMDAAGHKVRIVSGGLDTGRGYFAGGLTWCSSTCTCRLPMACRRRCCCVDLNLMGGTYRSSPLGCRRQVSKGIAS